MDTPFAILRIAKRKDIGAVRRCVAHHLRSSPTPNANPDEGIRVLAGTSVAAEVVRQIDERTKPLKKRRDAVTALDVFAGASPSFFASGGDLKRFEACVMRWASETFGKANIRLAVTHMDEATPHIQLVVTPITPDGKLSASHWVDGPKKLSSLQDTFARHLEPLGLHRGVKGSKARHQDVKKWYSDLLPRIRAAEEEIARVAHESAELEEKRSYLAKIYSVMSEGQKNQLRRMLSAPVDSKHTYQPK